jgi:ferric-dicitrate binding protein FerR (iron transport regulator)
METREFECVDPELGQLLPLLEAGLLEDAEQTLLESHLEACQRCDEDRGAWRELVARIKSVPPDAVGSARQETSAPEMRRKHVASRIAAALLLAIALGGLAWSSRRQTTLAGQVLILEGRLARLEGENRAIDMKIYPVSRPTFVRPPNF